jgi:Flp pilus assembly protein TadG
MRRLRQESGATLVEFALVSIVFLMTIFGVFDFGLAIWRYNIVADLAQEGARWASVHGKKSLSPASAADVQTYINTRSPGLTVTVTTTPDPSTLAQGNTVSVVVSATYAPLTQLVPQGTRTLTSTAKMIVAR